MNPTRIICGVLLLSLCVFGLPEGCLVFASHEAAPPLPVYDTEPTDRIAPERLGKEPEQEAPSFRSPPSLFAS
jgi:hypothetical protein